MYDMIEPEDRVLLKRAVKTDAVSRFSFAHSLKLLGFI
jgi:hypothetical protein